MSGNDKPGLSYKARRRWSMVLLLIGLLVATVVLFYQGLQPEPLVSVTGSARQQDVGRLKAMLEQHDPRDLRDGEARTVTVIQRDLNVS